MHLFYSHIAVALVIFSSGFLGLSGFPASPWLLVEFRQIDAHHGLLHLNLIVEPWPDARELDGRGEGQHRIVKGGGPVLPQL